jgi:hypothetical protein
VTRAQLAALIGLRLEGALARAPRRVPEVATDTRGHWAAAQIAAVTQAGVMEVFPNHTFQPNGVVRRADLAAAMAALLTLAKRRPVCPGGRRRGRHSATCPPRISSIARRLLPVSAGAMTADAGRFEPSRPATGAEVQAAVERLEQLRIG